MKRKRRLPSMLIPTLVMGVLAAVLVFLSYQKGVHILGLKSAGNMLLQMLPLLVLAIIAAGAIQYLISSELITKWIGAESGVRGILIGTAIGACTPGGPYVSLPIAVGLLRTGANIGTMIAFITSWSLIAFSRLPMEIGIMGWKFTTIRLACTFFFAPIAGLLANALFARVRLF